MMNPQYGEVLLMAHLNTCSFRIPQSWLGASIHRIDPHTTELRPRETVCRHLKEAFLFC